jgi:hypothetical protein
VRLSCSLSFLLPPTQQTIFIIAQIVTGKKILIFYYYFHTKVIMIFNPDPYFFKALPKAAAMEFK